MQESGSGEEVNEFNAIPLYRLLSEAAKRHGDEVVWVLGACDEQQMAMEASQAAMLASPFVLTRPSAAADNLEKSALIALSLAKKLREK